MLLMKERNADKLGTGHRKTVCKCEAAGWPESPCRRNLAKRKKESSKEVLESMLSG